MQNYFEYLRYYGNLSFSKVKLNEVDMGIFSTLVYLPYIKITNGITMRPDTWLQELQSCCGWPMIPTIITMTITMVLVAPQQEC